MSISVNPPKSPVTAGSTGVAAATVPNVCKMPGPPAPFVPTPLPNIGTSSSDPKKYSKKVKFKKKAVAIKGATFGSKGDVASKGTGGGLVSANTHGPTSFVGPGSFDVKVEGKNVQLLSDPMLNNCGGSGNPPNAATLAGVLQAPGLLAVAGDEQCPLCQADHGEEGQLEETKDTKGAAAAVKAATVAAVTAAKAEVEARRLAAQAINNANHAAWVAKMEASALAAPQAAERIRGLIAKKKPRVATVAGATTIKTMIGAVECKLGEIYAGFSSEQYKDVQKLQPGGFHSPYAFASLLPEEDPEPNPGLPGLDRFLPHATNPDRFEDAWDKAETESRRYTGADGQTAAYTPGQCAAQQMVLLAMDHGCRPIGLTEQYYNSGKPEARYNAPVNVRDGADGPVRQSKPYEFGGDDAVPPCKTCEVILNALMCFEDEHPTCTHRTPKPKVCSKC